MLYRRVFCVTTGGVVCPNVLPGNKEGLRACGRNTFARRLYAGIERNGCPGEPTCEWD